MAFICALIGLVIVLSTLRKGADPLSPARVFGLVWAIAVGLAELKLSKLQHQWSTESWIQLLIGPAAFLVGVFIVYILNLRTPIQPVAQVRSRWRLHNIDTGRLFVLTAGLSVLFVLGYIGILLLGREIPLFSAKPGVARLQFQIFGIGLFLHNVVLIIFFTVLYFLSTSGKNPRKWFLLGLALISVVLYGLTLQRFQIVMSIVISATFLFYTTRHLRFTTITAYLSALIGFFFLISTVRSGQLFMYYLYIDSKMTFSPRYAMFTEPYMYLVMNLENFARSIDLHERFTLGYFSFDFVTALTGLKHWLSQYAGLVETPFLISGYNTYSMFWSYYRDFGAIGVAMFPLLLGIIVASIYYSARRNPSIEGISAYSVCVFIMLFSFFLNPLSLLWFVYNMVVMFLVFRLARTPSTHSALE